MAPNLPSPRAARGRSRPWRSGLSGPWEGPFSVMPPRGGGGSLCGTQRSAALLAPHSVSSGRRKEDTAHSPA